MIQYGKHSINEDDIEAVGESLRSNWLTTGPLVEKFESEIEKIVGAPTVTVTSGTAALHSAYAAIGLNQGDEVITPPITFVATQATAALMGATIVFADIIQETGNVDPEKVEKAITKKTKAIVAVDYAGHPADLDELKAIANKHNVYLIEDAAHSIGSIYRGRPVGSIADITTFSFFPTKNMTTAEGGAISSTNEVLLRNSRLFSRQGLIREASEFELIPDGIWHQEVHNFGLNYRLPDVLCALGISQIKRLEEFKKRRRQVFEYYQEELSQIPWIDTPVEREYVDTNWHLFPIQVPAEERLNFFNYLRRNEIVVQVNYIPAHLHPVFRRMGHKKGDFPKSELFYSREISLPMHTSLSDQELEWIVGTMKKFKL
jgi:dTDP-4-amino-4,6-dideoxygalactose transaminase